MFQLSLGAILKRRSMPTYEEVFSQMKLMKNKFISLQETGALSTMQQAVIHETTGKIQFSLLSLFLYEIFKKKT